MAVALPRAEPLLPVLTLVQWAEHPHTATHMPLWLVLSDRGEILTGNLTWSEAVRWAAYHLEWYRAVWMRHGVDPYTLWAPYLGPWVST